MACHQIAQSSLLLPVYTAEVFRWKWVGGHRYHSLIKRKISTLKEAPKSIVGFDIFLPMFAFSTGSDSVKFFCSDLIAHYNNPQEKKYSVHAAMPLPRKNAPIQTAIVSFTLPSHGLSIYFLGRCSSHSSTPTHGCTECACCLHHCHIPHIAIPEVIYKPPHIRIGALGEDRFCD